MLKEKKEKEKDLQKINSHVLSSKLGGKRSL